MQTLNRLRGILPSVRPSPGVGPAVTTPPPRRRGRALRRAVVACAIALVSLVLVPAEAEAQPKDCDQIARMIVLHNAYYYIAWNNDDQAGMRFWDAVLRMENEIYGASC